ncbi:MAG: hypothetical protein LBK46_06310 [Oscillospiraceae bacterium]|jgi:hypothetical protein|nr:hypothetical protein [Oscillospiraceae bacterium]
MARRYYNIAGLNVSINELPGTEPLASFEPFAFKDGHAFDGEPDLAITLQAYDPGDPARLPVPAEDAMDLISEDLVNRLYLWNGQLVKRTAMREGDTRCMWTLMPPNDYTRAEVFIPDNWLDYENYGNAFLFEKMLLSHGVIMLHCALIETSRGGVAFTAPSQTGKSTQANLWRENRSARILNGDRAILRAHPDGIYAYGSPWAGSSEIYENASVKLAALVALAQAPVNTVRPLTHTECLQYILAGTSLPLWDERLFNLGMDTVERVLTDVQMPLLSCTPDVRAIEALEAYLNW